MATAKDEPGNTRATRSAPERLTISSTPVSVDTHSDPSGPRAVCQATPSDRPSAFSTVSQWP